MHAQTKLIERKGVAYFRDFSAARDHGAEHCQGFPSWRIVSYTLGYAVQVRPAGPYLDSTGNIESP